jgi:hypothetical protein
MWSFLSSLVSWIPAIIRSMSDSKKLDSAIERAQNLDKIQIKKESDDKWTGKRSASSK